MAKYFQLLIEPPINLSMHDVLCQDCTGYSQLKFLLPRRLDQASKGTPVTTMVLELQRLVALEAEDDGTHSDDSSYRAESDSASLRKESRTNTLTKKVNLHGETGSMSVPIQDLVNGKLLFHGQKR